MALASDGTAAPSSPLEGSLFVFLDGNPGEETEPLIRNALVTAPGAARTPAVLDPEGREGGGPFPTLSIEPTAAAALPGRDFLVELRFFLPEGIYEASFQAEVPPGWGVRLGNVCQDVLPCPILAGPDRPATVPVILGVPAGALGRYPILFSLPRLGARWRWEVVVKDCLDPVDVVRHWDVEGDRLDLSVEGEVTYERLLWAIARLGRRLPFACRSLQSRDLEILAAQWRGEQNRLRG